ncbi:MAG: phosphoribosylformylglycinamidine cyclo-ligase, partial [Shimia sp.]|nr:phosphoribosylformylglycinamidine cyclo-ligase [Shimia sp.]
VGMILSVEADQAEALTALLQEQGETVYTLGTVQVGEGVSYTGSLL